MLHKKDTAFIQMAEPKQALLAINHLDKTKLWGKVIRVMHSKHTTVQVLLPDTFYWSCRISFSLFQLPKDGQQGADLTQDYAKYSFN